MCALRCAGKLTLHWHDNVDVSAEFLVSIWPLNLRSVSMFGQHSRHTFSPISNRHINIYIVIPGCLAAWLCVQTLRTSVWESTFRLFLSNRCAAYQRGQNSRKMFRMPCRLQFVFPSIPKRVHRRPFSLLTAFLLTHETFRRDIVLSPTAFALLLVVCVSNATNAIL